MYGTGAHQAQRIASLRRRARGLRELRTFVGIPRGPSDLSRTQWMSIEAVLGAAADRIETRLDTVARVGLLETHEIGGRRRVASEVGRSELELASSYAIFDTFMDVLTQRASPWLGALLKGCDVLALDAMRSEQHPALALASAPIVYLNRGFGAAILRSGVSLAPAAKSPMPLVQIPYARLQEKYHLSSLVHEVGHETLVRLGLRSPLVRAVREGLDGRVAPAVRDACAVWMNELGPDFWAFGCCGAAHALTVRDALALPSRVTYDVRPNAVHPPVWFRTMIAFDWCRRAFGRGEWDDWERRYLQLFPLALAPAKDRAFLDVALREAVPRIGDVLFGRRFPTLDRRTLADLFGIARLHPLRLSRALHGAKTTSAAFRTERPTTQLAAFRWMRERSDISESRLDEAMSTWLRGLSPSSRRTPTETDRGRTWPATSRA